MNAVETEIPERNGKPATHPAPLPEARYEQVPPISESKESWYTWIVVMLGKFPTHKLVLISLLIIAVIMLRTGEELTLLKLIGVLVVALLIVIYGSLVHFSSRTYAQNQQEFRDQQAQPRTPDRGESQT